MTTKLKDLAKTKCKHKGEVVWLCNVNHTDILRTIIVIVVGNMHKVKELVNIKNT